MIEYSEKTIRFYFIWFVSLVKWDWISREMSEASSSSTHRSSAYLNALTQEIEKKLQRVRSISVLKSTLTVCLFPKKMPCLVEIKQVPRW